MMNAPRTAAVLAMVFLLVPLAGCVDLPEKDAERITTGDGWVHRDVDSIDMSARYIVYSREVRVANGTEVDVLDGVYVYDLENERETRIADGAVQVRVSNDLVVWQDDGTVMARNLTKGVTVEINGTNALGRPDVSGPFVVWADQGPPEDPHLPDIVMSLAVNGTRYILSNGSAERWPPSIHGRRVVWMEVTDDGRQLMMHDLDNGTTVQMTRYALMPSHPEIWGDIVVWLDRRPDLLDDCTDVYALDVTTGVERQVSDTCGATDVDIHGDRVVWEDHSGPSDPWESGDIMMFDLGTGKRTVLTDNGKSQWSPAIHGDLIAWGDDRESDGDIHLTTLKHDTILGIDVHIVYILIVAGTLTALALGLYIYHERRPLGPEGTVHEEKKRRLREDVEKRRGIARDATVRTAPQRSDGVRGHRRRR